MNRDEKYMSLHKPRRKCEGVIRPLGSALIAAALILAAPCVAAPKATEIPTLDEIAIEGDIESPQVLFILAEETPRFDDGLLHLFEQSADPDSIGSYLWLVIDSEH